MEAAALHGEREHALQHRQLAADFGPRRVHLPWGYPVPRERPNQRSPPDVVKQVLLAGIPRYTLYTITVRKRTEPKVFTAVRLDPELLAGLRQIQVEVGISVAEQIRRAVRQWLVQQGVGLPRRRSSKGSK